METLVAEIKTEFDALVRGEVTPQEFSDSVRNRVYPDQVKDLPRAVKLRSSRGRQIHLGIQRDTWLSEYANTVSCLMNSHVNNSHEVEGYRENYLAGRGLATLEDIWEYVNRLAERARGESAEMGELRSLHVGLGPSKETVTIPKEPTGELKELLKITREIMTSLSCNRAWALFFVFAPTLQMNHIPYSVRFQDSSYKFARRLVIEVDPVLTPEDVRDLYRRARAELAPRAKSISKQRLRLVAHAATFPFLSWDDLRDKWNLFNRRSPALQYGPPPQKAIKVLDERANAYENWARQYNSARNNFRRDITAAWRWVSGQDGPRRPRKAPLPQPTDEQLKALEERLREDPKKRLLKGLEHIERMEIDDNEKT
jgi:hypothetical protein